MSGTQSGSGFQPEHMHRLEAGATQPESGSGFQPEHMHRLEAGATLPDLFFDPYAGTTISERNLPHWKQDGKLYFLTWRLADSLPREKREQLQQERDAWEQRHGARSPKELTAAERRSYYELFHERVQTWLDAGSGSCVLKEEAPQRIVVNALHHFNGIRYRLGTFAVAGNHVHVLAAPLADITLSSVLHSWKSFTANAINRALGRTGKLWQDESYDHLVRNGDELARIEAYIIGHGTKGAHVEHHPVVADMEPRSDP